MSAAGWGWLVLVFPLAGTVLCSLLYRTVPARTTGFIGSAAIGLSFAAGLIATLKLQDLPPDGRHVISNAFDYASSSGIAVKLGILFDPLAAFMVLVVTGVSF